MTGEHRGLLATVGAAVGSELPMPRLLLVFAHPDDEVLAVGGRLEQMAASRFVTVTDGAPADGTDARHHGFADVDAYREARRREMLAALAHAGLGPEVVATFAAQVPDQGASFRMAELAQAVAGEIARFQPQAVLTHPYEGGHPDHDACAFAVHAAKALAGVPDDLLILEAPFYHAGEDGSMRTGAFLEETDAGEGMTWELTPLERENKRARLTCFASQAETLAQFGVEREQIRVAPAYDFTRPPHAGQLLYERFPWGMTGERYRTLAAAACREMFGVGVMPLEHDRRPRATAEA